MLVALLLYDIQYTYKEWTQEGGGPGAGEEGGDEEEGDKAEAEEAGGMCSGLQEK